MDFHTDDQNATVFANAAAVQFSVRDADVQGGFLFRVSNLMRGPCTNNGFTLASHATQDAVNSSGWTRIRYPLSDFGCNGGVRRRKAGCAWLWGGGWARAAIDLISWTLLLLLCRSRCGI